RRSLPLASWRPGLRREARRGGTRARRRTLPVVAHGGSVLRPVPATRRPGLAAMPDDTTIYVPPARPSFLKEVAKSVARLFALVAVLPLLGGYWLNAAFVGRNRALEAAS